MGDELEVILNGVVSRLEAASRCLLRGGRGGGGGGAFAQVDAEQVFAGQGD